MKKLFLSYLSMNYSVLVRDSGIYRQDMDSLHDAILAAYDSIRKSRSDVYDFTAVLKKHYRSIVRNKYISDDVMIPFEDDKLEWLQAMNAENDEENGAEPDSSPQEGYIRRYIERHQVLKLYYLQGYSVRAIAAYTGKSVSAITAMIDNHKKHISNGIGNIRQKNKRVS
jgi:predicted DNA-binding protein YlxM (UPF0122 family)